MIDRTSTPYAPWTLVEAEDKRWARVKVLETLCERLAQAICDAARTRQLCTPQAPANTRWRAAQAGCA